MSESATKLAEEQKSREFTTTTPGPDGTFEVVTVLEKNEDATKPPRLVNIEKHAVTPTPASNSASTAEQRETHIILSVGSGHQQAAYFFRDVVSPILLALYGLERTKNMKLHITESATSILDLTNELLFPEANGTSVTDPAGASVVGTNEEEILPPPHDGKALRIILLSGDGGIVDLVNGILAKTARAEYVAPQVVLLPLGTGNALYHSINTGKENTWGLDALSSTTSKPLPAFTASFSPGARLLIDEARSEEELPKDAEGKGILHGAVVCSWGMHASLVADSDTTEYRKFGVERFKMAAKEALYPSDNAPPHAYKAKVSVLKGEELTVLPEEEHMYVLSTLVSNLEQPFCISPESKPLDGSMHLVHFGPTSGDEAMRIMGLAYQGGKHVGDPAVRYEAIDGLRIEFQGKEEDARWRRVCVDGKIVRVESDGWVEVRKEKRRMLDVVVI